MAMRVSDSYPDVRLALVNAFLEITPHLNVAPTAEFITETDSDISILSKQAP